MTRTVNQSSGKENDIDHVRNSNLLDYMIEYEPI